jgi:hypothetical protein
MNTTIQQLKEKLKKLEEEIQELKTKEEEEKGLWFPKDGEEYYYIDREGKVYWKWFYDSHEEIEDRGCIEIGNFYKTKELAEKEIEKRKAIQRLKTAWAKDYYFVPDFNSGDIKHCIHGWNYTDGSVEYAFCGRMDVSKYGLVFYSKEKMKQFIEENAKDLELVLKNY